MGVGWMSLSFGFSKTHMTGGVVGTVLIGVIAWTAILCLVRVYEVWIGRPKGIGHTDHSQVECWAKHELTFTKLAELTLGDPGKLCVQASIVVAQLGLMMAYQIYIGTIGTYFFPAVPEWVWVLGFYTIFVFVCQLRDIRVLLHSSGVGTIASLTCMLAACGVCVGKVSDRGEMNPTVNTGLDATMFATFFGTMFFAMEGTVVILPVLHKMRDAETQACSMCSTVCLVVTVLYGLVGALGYAAYGSGVEAPLTENMTNGLIMNGLRILQGVVVAVTFPIQCFPIAAMADEIFPTHPGTLRVLLVTTPTAAAIVFPFMADCVGIVGGAAMTMLGCCIPYAMFLAEFWHEVGWEGRHALGVATGIGALLGLAATAESTVRLVADFK